VNEKKAELRWLLKKHKYIEVENRHNPGENMWEKFFYKYIGEYMVVVWFFDTQFYVVFLRKEKGDSCILCEGYSHYFKHMGFVWRSCFWLYEGWRTRLMEFNRRWKEETE